MFGSPKLNLKEVLTGLQDTLQPEIMVGCSSAGEFAGAQLAEGAISALAIYSDEIEFQVCVGTGIKRDVQSAATALTSCLGQDVYRFRHRYILLLTDALAGYTEEFLGKINELTAGAFQIFGGGAGDDAQFQSTYVFAGTEILQDAAVGLAILTDKPLGIGVRHGWKPIEPGMRATETDGFELVSLNAEPAYDVFLRHAQSREQTLDRDNPMPFFLHNVLGISTTAGYKIRVPLGFTEGGGVICATEIPLGATVNFMQTDGGSAVEAASLATQTALSQIEGENPAGVIFFDCVATRLRLGSGFGAELQAVRDKIDPAAFVGCNSYGQVARVDGQFSGFHNCTAVVCVIPS
ncbi:MAG: FIST signal transduction protein [Fimbriimonas sp.]